MNKNKKTRNLWQLSNIFLILLKFTISTQDSVTVCYNSNYTLACYGPSICNFRLSVHFSYIIIDINVLLSYTS